MRLADRLEVEPAKDAPALLGTIIAGLLKNHYRDTDAQREREVLVDFAAEERRAAVPADTSGHLTLPPERIEFARSIVAAVTVPPTDLDDVEFRHDFDLALRALPVEQRDAFILTELRGLSEREASVVLDTSQMTIHRRAEAARIYIRKELVAP